MVKDVSRLGSRSEALSNRLLAVLPAAQLDAILPQLRRETLASWDLICEAHAPIRRVYFPVNGIISFVCPMEDGSIAESYTVGREGAAGAELVLGTDRLVQRQMCQVPGVFYWISADEFLQLVEREPAIGAAVRRYLHCMFTLVAQAAACNLTHDVSARCARWLLTVSDRTGKDEFDLTQEILAAMLGVHRPAVTIAAGALQKAGLIRYSRGCVRVIDREKLEEAACECYRIIENETARVLAPTAPPQ